MPDSEKERLLSLLEAHGQAFLKSIGPTNIDSARKYPTSSHKRRRLSEELSDHDAEEWHGINTPISSHQYSEDKLSDIGSFEHWEDEFIADSASTNVVVFSDTASKRPLTHESKSQMGAFMSSKISKLRDSHSDTHAPQHRATTDKDDDWTNAQNDALLHKLIHTKLLSGSLNQDLKLPPAKKRKALEGRILELTADAKLGKGERQVREAERNKAAKRVREGIAQKQKERQKQELEEAKNLGNYHPTLKKVFEASPTSNTRKREKGLRMGVGKFSHGSLRLSRDDISRVMGEGHSRSR